MGCHRQLSGHLRVSGFDAGRVGPNGLLFTSWKKTVHSPYGFAKELWELEQPGPGVRWFIHVLQAPSEGFMRCGGSSMDAAGWALALSHHQP